MNKAAGKADDEEEKEESGMIDTSVPASEPNPEEMEDNAEMVRKGLEVCKSAAKKENMHCLVQEFEKDDDSNCHVDFIAACANIRASNYTLAEMDWLTVKLKAGRIVPALATTTACVAGLQSIELLKLLKGVKVNVLRNTNLNLALPLLMLPEPGPPGKKAIRKGIPGYPDVETTIWDRWEVKATSNQ